MSGPPSCGARKHGSSGWFYRSSKIPIFPAFAEVVGGALAQQGFTPVLCTRTAGGVAEADYVELLLQQQVSGVVFAGGLYAQADASHAHYARLVERSIPVVLVNAAVASLGFPRVSCDDSLAAEQAIGHLISLGHKRIGLVVGPPDHVPTQRKLAAARQMAQRRGISLSEDQIAHAIFSLEGGQAATSDLLGEGVTGIICASDPLALGAIRAARRAGLSVPGDLSVVGYDDSIFMSCIEPPSQRFASRSRQWDARRWIGWWRRWTATRSGPTNSSLPPSWWSEPRQPSPAIAS